MKLRREILCHTSASRIETFNTLLHPILEECFADHRTSGWHVMALRVGRDGCNLATNSISSWIILRYKKWLRQETALTITTVPTLQDTITIRFFADDEYWKTFGSTIDAIRERMKQGTEGFNVVVQSSGRDKDFITPNSIHMSLDDQDVKQPGKNQSEALLNIKGRRLQVLEQQAARYGVDCPAHIVLEIEDLRKEIEDLK